MDLRDQVKHKVACIQDTIAAIADVQQQLKVKSLEAKSNIHSSISRQLETLRSREVWLMNQVDVIRHVKEERLQGQLACLLHELGGLQHLIQITQRCGTSCEDLKQELAETLCRLKDLDDKPLEEADVGFSADVNKLRRAICSYGRIDAAGHTMEDYAVPDSLYNSLVGLTLTDQAAAGDAMVETEFPPFTAATSLSEWLAERDADDFEVLDNEAFEVMMPPSDDQPTIPQPLDSYFKQVNLSPLAEWLFDSQRLQAEFSLGKSYPYAVMKYFREISDDVRDWLVDYERSHQDDMEDMEVKSKDCKADMCHCAGPPEGFVMQPIEIENLDQLICMQDPVTNLIEEQPSDKNKWLRNYDDIQMDSECTAPIALPCVDSTCMANEPCNNFTECVCDTNCAVTAIAQSNPSLDPNQVLAYFHKASKNPSDWLAPTSSGNSDKNIRSVHQEPDHHWIRKNEENESVQGSNVCEFAYFHSVKTNTSDWLQQSSENCQSPVDVTSPLDAYFQQRSGKIDDWLRKESQEKSEEMQESEVSDKKDEKNAEWLHCSHSSQDNSLSTSSWEVVQKYHGQLAHSDWLTSQVQPKSKCEWLLDSCSSSSLSSPSTANVEAYKLFLQLGHSGDENEWLKQ